MAREFGLLEQLGQRRNGVVRFLDGGDALAHGVQQTVQIAGPVVERLGGEEVARIVESAVDLAAGGQPSLDGVDVALGVDEGEKVGAHGSGESEVTGHNGFLS